MSKRLDEMRANPRGDWTIADVRALCRAERLNCLAPRGGGSHCKITHPSQSMILTVPSKRPIKPIYIRKLVAMVGAVRALR